MRRIVFSKQADYDAEMWDFWWFWYTRIFKADTFIITPVKQPNSKIDEAVRWFADKGCHIHTIVLPEWDDWELWCQQKEIVRPYLVPGENFLAVSADADQFFEFVPDTDEGVAVTFDRIMIVAEEPPTPERLPHIKMPCSQRGKSAAFRGTLDTKHVACTGHCSRLETTPPKLYEFHYGQHGFSHFLKKVENIYFDPDKPDNAATRHWRHWHKVHKTEGEAGVRRIYDEIVRRDGQGYHPALERFIAPVVRELSWGGAE